MNIVEAIQKSYLTDTNVSAARLYGWVALFCTYGMWIVQNVTANAAALIQVIRGQSGTFQIYGWSEIVMLTGGIIAGKVVQSFSKSEIQEAK